MRRTRGRTIGKAAEPLSPLHGPASFLLLTLILSLSGRNEARRRMWRIVRVGMEHGLLHHDGGGFFVEFRREFGTEMY